jgi:hypothetical protein
VDLWRGKKGVCSSLAISYHPEEFTTLVRNV